MNVIPTCQLRTFNFIRCTFDWCVLICPCLQNYNKKVKYLLRFLSWEITYYYLCMTALFPRFTIICLGFFLTSKKLNFLQHQVVVLIRLKSRSCKCPHTTHRSWRAWVQSKKFTSCQVQVTKQSSHLLTAVGHFLPRLIIKHMTMKAKPSFISTGSCL